MTIPSLAPKLGTVMSATAIPPIASPVYHPAAPPVVVIIPPPAAVMKPTASATVVAPLPIVPIAPTTPWISPNAPSMAPVVTQAPIYHTPDTTAQSPVLTAKLPVIAMPATGLTGGPANSPPVTPTTPDEPFVPSQQNGVWSDSSANLPPNASQATSNDPNLPSQASDATQWNDPAPLVVSATGTVPGPAGTNSGIAPTGAAVVSTPVVQSLWTRFWTFLGFIKPAVVPTATVHGEQTIEQAAVSLVRRANNGDQNAMGLIVMIRENAKKGLQPALQTYDLMRAYAEKQARIAGEPSARQPYNMGGEPSRRQPYNMGADPGWAKAVYLANGPLLRDVKVAHVASSFGEERDSHAFVAGVIDPTYPAVSEAHHHGKVVGMARKIQAVRMPGSRISDYSATVGWELGE